MTMWGSGNRARRKWLLVAAGLVVGLATLGPLDAGEERGIEAPQIVSADRPATPAVPPSPEPPQNGAEPYDNEPALVSDPGQGNDPGSDAGATPALYFVYFVESDEEFQPESLALIEQQAIDLQAFWYDQFGGTFRLADPVVEVVYGHHPADWYDSTPNGDDPRWYRLGNIEEEVEATLGLSGGDDDVRIITYPSARIDGRVGANRYEGAWLDGDDIACIDGSVDTTPYSSDFPANCLATAAHELGHVYGLGHEGADEDCMQFGFYQYVSNAERCDFTEENRQIVLDDPRNAGWLDARPGDHAPQ